MQRRQFFMLAAVILTLSGCQSTSKKTPTTPSTSKAPTSSEASMVGTATTPAPPTAAEITTLTALAKTSLVRIATTKGVIDLELYPDVAPVHVANFLKLIQAGFYNGLTFHRVVPEFVVQGGDPEGTGRGGPGYTIKAEFSDKKHLTGTLAMARSSDPDSAGSQFYLTLAPQPGLDHDYTVFGQTIAGLDVLATIAIGDTMTKLEILPKSDAKNV